MARLKFEMWRHSPEGGGIMFSFTDGNGNRAETWFGAPPGSIDHVCLVYLKNRFPNVKNDRHCQFIKRRYKEEIMRLKAVSGGNEHESNIIEN